MRASPAGMPCRGAALLMSPTIYNSEAGLMVRCPLSTQVKV